MGAPLLRAAVLALFLVAAGCGDPARPDGRASPDAGAPADSARLAAAGGGEAPGEDPHRKVSCSGCHAGGRADEGRALVPRASCTAAGCHDDAGPERVRLATTTFEHRRHGTRGEIEASCAGCHTHDEGGEPLRAAVDACVLCHLPEVTSSAPQDCQLCHRAASHVTLTSAGVPVPHASLQWLEIGCVRCHYDVADPPLEVSGERCAACHRDLRAVTARGAGKDLHPDHAGLTCTACHAGNSHRILAVSSAVRLVCADCHATGHDLPLAGWGESPREWSDMQTCAACHQDVHAAQQQLLLGLLPDGRAYASTKFAAGLTCRSCHVPPPAGTPEKPIRGQARACQACHTREYDRVLEWWIDGTERRLQATTAHLQAAERRLGSGAPDSARALLASSAGMLELVRQAGGQHNLELADRIFRESLVRVDSAYRLAGRTPPGRPALGRPPHFGLCSGCHYGQGVLDWRTMPSDFHTELLRSAEDREEGRR